MQALQLFVHCSVPKCAENAEQSKGDSAGGSTRMNARITAVLNDCGRTASAHPKENRRTEARQQHHPPSSNKQRVQKPRELKTIAPQRLIFDYLLWMLEHIGCGGWRLNQSARQQISFTRCQRAPRISRTNNSFREGSDQPASQPASSARNLLLRGKVNWLA